jgi:hypothetical protein
MSFFAKCIRVFVVSVRAVSATAAAAMAAFEVEFFGKDLPTFGREIVIFALNQFICLVLPVH